MTFAQIVEIVKSYAAVINPTAEQITIAEIRLKTCRGCEFWKVSDLGIRYCEKCGCATKAKVFTPKGLEGCPEKKWTI